MKSVTLRAREPEEPRPHRHCLPNFRRTSSHVIVRRIHASIEGHNWRQNPFAIEMRIQKGQRTAIRSEARETLKPLCKALAFYTDYSADSKYQFECWANVPYLAKQISAMYLVDDQHVRYDTVLNALELLEDMQAIHLVRDYDHATKRHKLMRVFLLPTFFRMFGFNDKEIGKLIEANRLAMSKLPADQRSIMSHMWAGTGVSENTKAMIRSQTASKKIKWTRRKYKNKAANDPVALALVQAAAMKATPDGGGRHKAQASDASMASARLRENISQAEIWKIRGSIQAAHGYSGAELELAVDNYLRQRQLN